ncbi:exosortase E/protease, VPEID-CTERM system (plasmid) [Leisingera sp. S132]|uniref:exosortase E/protease, VPEID-CTERM system n=1 Tax=Leisingera sp. S132 TaxID=2867016 RepID=UPI0021A7B349|nr:exosortase E/protease, VPEID-CTERM system [Leisingera sp. S132]UWQ81920.1 exosortase E/protease, VPEID-CTERM system [Leisingera sp. S132]
MSNPEANLQPGWMFKPASVRLFILLAVVMAEAVALRLLTFETSQFDCRNVSAYALCRSMRALPLCVLFMGTAVVLMSLARPRLWQSYMRLAEAAAGWRLVPAAMHLLGAALVLAPLVWLPLPDLEAQFLRVVPVFLSGAVLAFSGTALWLLPLRAWTQWFSGNGAFLPLAAAGFFLLPLVVEVIGLFWGENRVLTWLTFQGVSFAFDVIGLESFSMPSELIIGLEGFTVYIAAGCSGAEGMALVMVFMGLYALVARQTLRMGPYWMMLFPVAVALSWVLNIVRISGLIWLGANVSPQLAVDGFHSYAGWLAFSVLALGILMAAHNMPLFRAAAPAGARAPGTAWAADPLFARFVPFILFMMSGTLTPLFWENPADGYPLRVAFMVLGLGLFRPALKAFRWRAGPADWATGCAVAALWLWTAPEAAAAASAAGAPDPVWILCRLLGTVLLVPVIEELFFRAYVLERIAGRPGAAPWRVLAGLAVSSLLFAALHDRWLAGALAGLAFGLLYLRTRHPGGAVQAHMLANALIAAAAVASGDFGLI